MIKILFKIACLASLFVVTLPASSLSICTIDFTVLNAGCKISRPNITAKSWPAKIRITGLSAPINVVCEIQSATFPGGVMNHETLTTADAKAISLKCAQQNQTKCTQYISMQTGWDSLSYNPDFSSVCFWK